MKKFSVSAKYSSNLQMSFLRIVQHSHGLQDLRFCCGSNHKSNHGPINTVDLVHLNPIVKMVSFLTDLVDC